MISAIEPPKQNRCVLFYCASKDDKLEGTEPRSADNTARFLASSRKEVGHMHNIYDTTVSSRSVKDNTRSAWTEVELFVKSGAYWLSELPSEPACYALYLDGSLKYIGQTCDIRKRMAGHGLDVAKYSSNIETPWGMCKRLHLKYRRARKYGDWAMVELRLIKRLQPEYNCVGCRTKKRERA